ncbi:TlpA family protein disulfide reductase [Aquimarina sp. AD1]|uniref:TlpA family protein disulfide reductase n=1 Tax=Aquimarina sp. (strain AD1) TaxID=1714848 RepID=UPI000E514544|nr:TlpA disulfide reductase family protein [Aquimarina sp. AD1]AXT57999.1 TlpA family protein disulfide reductase [Aquimarina sp. AD1]RKN33141.1 TlpA family protein disulfide reductase [Aquimarina sp. AD1]
MKTRILTVVTLFLLLTSFINHAQSTYYRGHDGILLDEAELKEAESKMKDKIQKINKKAVVEIEIKDTDFRKDSIIHDFGFHVNLNGTLNLKTKLNSYKGKKMLASSLITLQGDQINISDLEGKPTLLNFWFTNCPPCIDEMPELNKLKEHFGERVNFVAITYESKEKVEKFLKKYKFDFRHVIDAREYTDALEMKSFPNNIILDKNGVVKNIEGGIPYIRDENGGMKMGEATELKRKLETLLK